MPRKQKVKLDKACKEFIIDKISEGMSILQICKQFPDKVPTDKYVYRYAEKDPKFYQQVTDAYTILFFRLGDQMRDLASTPAIELYPDCTDWREAEATKKAAIHAIQYTLSSLAPIYTKRFDKTQKVDINASLQSNTKQELDVNVVYAINYSEMPAAVALDNARQLINVKSNADE